MNHLIGKIYLLQEFIRKAFYKLFRVPFIKAAFHSCGENVHISEQEHLHWYGTCPSAGIC